MIDYNTLRNGQIVYIHAQSRVYQAVAQPRATSRTDPDAWTFLVHNGRRMTPPPKTIYATAFEALRARGIGGEVDKISRHEKDAWGALPESLPGPQATREEVDAWYCANGDEPSNAQTQARAK